MTLSAAEKSSMVHHACGSLAGNVGADLNPRSLLRYRGVVQPMQPPRKLGRGLGSLLSARHGFEESTSESDGRLWVSLDLISPSAEQPRKDLDRGLEGLAESLRKHGMMQPIIVTRREDGTFEILAGERRWRAARLAGMKSVPVLERAEPASLGERLELALIENIQREDLNPIERAQACQRLVAEHGYTQERVAERLGYQRSTVANLIRLLELPAELQADVSRETITAGHARALLQLQGTPLQDEAKKRIVEEDLSVRQAEQLCKAWAEHGAEPKHRARPRKPNWVADLQEKLTRELGLRTEVQLHAKGGGKVILHFQDLEQLDRLAQRFSGVSEAQELMEGELA